MYKKLTYRFLILLAIAFVLDRGIGAYLDHLYEENRCDYSNGRINKFMDQENCDTLYLGSSRVLHMIKPELLGPNSRNLAMQHKHLYHNVALVDILKKENKLPTKVLVFNFEVEDLYMKTEHHLLDQLYSLKYYYDKNELVKRLINRKGFQERIKFLSRVYRHNGEGWKLISYPMAGNCVDPSDDGYYPLYHTELDSARLAQSLIDDFKPFDFEKLNPVALEMLDYLRDLCKKENIELKIIHGPYYKLHPELIEASKYMKAYCKKKGVSYYDYNDSTIPGLEIKDNWYDNMHLNDDGANIYTLYLKELFY